MKKSGCLIAVALVLIIPCYLLIQQLVGKILFVGVVVDENDHPVQGADCVMGIPGGQVGPGSSGSYFHTTSDSQGRFSFYGAVVGADLEAHKQGYYDDDARGKITTLWTRTSPVVLRLHKKGDLASLLWHQTEYIGLNKLGAETGYDLNAIGTGPNDSLILEPKGDSTSKPMLLVKAWSDSNFPNYDKSQNIPNFVWHFRVSFPGGGLAPRNSRWDFTAPDSGYLETCEFTATDKPNQGLMPPIRGRYYFRLANGNYGRLELSISTFPIGSYSPGKNFAQVLLSNIYINTNGSRNLECDDGRGF